jgi:hypothetical protein
MIILTAKAFIVTRNTERAQKGLIVYEAAKHDYGLASADSRYMQEEYGSYSFSEDGNYPFVTIPKSALEPYVHSA